MDHLQRHRPLHEPVLGPVDDAHAAGPEDAHDAVAGVIDQFRRNPEVAARGWAASGPQAVDEGVVGHRRERLAATFAVRDVALDAGLQVRAEPALHERRQHLAARVLCPDRAHAAPSRRR